MAKRTTRITVETRSLTVLRARGSASFMRCEACGAETLMLAVEEAAALSSASHRDIFRLVEGRRVHYAETAAGRLLICAESLRRLAEGEACENERKETT
ncbi:MAG TPA: hypothetical protein VFX96_01585 [Pyrinomonadaceae bacterium]|nr:hypothetical protein [Pyrinomonadaceae bacterium]